MPMLRKVAARVSTSAVGATTAPPSAVVRFFVGKKENVVTSASDPTGRPSRVPPIEWAASSSEHRARPVQRATAARSTSIGWPP